MKTWIMLASFYCCLATVSAQSSKDEGNPPEEKKAENNQIILPESDKKMSFSSNPFSENQENQKKPETDSTYNKSPWSIHSEEWRPERSSQKNTPCSKARPQLNL